MFNFLFLSTKNKASLKCIEEFYLEKDNKCKLYFEEYKDCKKKELERLRENRGNGW